MKGKRDYEKKYLIFYISVISIESFMLYKVTAGTIGLSVGILI